MQWNLSSILTAFFSSLPPVLYPYWHSVLEFIAGISTEQWYSLFGHAFGFGLIVLLIIATMTTPSNGSMPPSDPARGDRSGDK